MLGKHGVSMGVRAFNFKVLEDFTLCQGGGGSSEGGGVAAKT